MQPSQPILEALAELGLDYRALPIQEIVLEIGIHGPPVISVQLIMYKPEHQEAIAKLIRRLKDEKRVMKIEAEGIEEG